MCTVRRPWLVLDPAFRDRLGRGRRSLRSPTTPGDASSSPRQPEQAGSSYGILSIAVSPRQRGTGLAPALLQAAECAALVRGFTRMHLTVSPTNQRAVSFYEKAGWAAVSAGADWHGAMEKNLD